MSPTWCKIFPRILDSSISDDVPLRRFFIELILLAHWNGHVDMPPSAIANRLRIPLDEVNEGLRKLQLPDPMSRIREFEGRRIIPLEGARYGWLIVNMTRYRDVRDDDGLRDANNQRNKQYRARKKLSKSVPRDVHDVTRDARDGGDVTHDDIERKMEMENKNQTEIENYNSGGEGNPPQGTDGWVNTEADDEIPSQDPIKHALPRLVQFIEPSLDEVKGEFDKRGVPNAEALKFHAYYSMRGWVPNGSSKPMKDWQAAVTGWAAKMDRFNDAPQRDYKPLRDTSTPADKPF